MLMRLLSVLCVLAAFTLPVEASFFWNGFHTVGSKALASVVSVSVLMKVNDTDELRHHLINIFNSPRRDIFGAEALNGPRKIVSSGSGFIISAEGHVVTNYHTIENAVKIKVTLSDESVWDAELIGFDMSTDLAVIKIKTTKKLPPLKWASSEKIKVGEWALALGNPYGLGGTLTCGVISSPARDITDPRFNFDALSLGKVIQTDAPINRGNSGGPLINTDGDVMGVNFALISSSGGNDGIGFAIPANVAKKITGNIIKYGHIKRAWLGVSVQSITKEISRNLNLKTTDGVIVVTVAENSPAMAAQLQSGDILLKIDHSFIKDARDFTRMMSEFSVGKHITLSLIRDHKKLEKEAILSEFQSPDDYKKTIKTSKTMLKDHFECVDFDFGVTSLTWQFRHQVLAQGTQLEGVMISDAQEGGWGEKYGFAVGDVILQINGKPVSSLENFVQLYSDAIKLNKPVLFFIYKNGARAFIAIDKKPN